MAPGAAETGSWPLTGAIEPPRGPYPALQCGGLQIASGIPHGAALVAEMADMRAKVTAAVYWKWTEQGDWERGIRE